MRLLVALALAIVSVVFAVQNVTVVPIEVLFWRLEASLALIIVLCIALGALTGILVCMPRILRMRASERRLRAELAVVGAPDVTTNEPGSVDRRATRSTASDAIDPHRTSHEKERSSRARRGLRLPRWSRQSFKGERP